MSDAIAYFPHEGRPFTENEPIIHLSKLDCRIPKWDMSRTEPRACPFCDSEGHPKYVRPDGLQVRRCAGCGAYFVSPSPDEESLSRLYANYFSSHSRVGPVNKHYAKDILFLDPMADFRIREIVSIMDVKGKRVLDIGCGKGESLIRFKKLGAMVEGIDLDADAVCFIKEHLGIPDIHCGSVEDYSSERKYDIILLNDMIEHPLRPLEILSRARQMLGKGGIISIFTPSALFKNTDDDPVAFRMDLEHMQYLSPGTCAYLSGRLGLEILHLETIGFPVLSGIDDPARISLRPGIMQPYLRMVVRHMPGFSSLNLARLLLKEERTGGYNLFCILRDPS